VIDGRKEGRGDDGRDGQWTIPVYDPDNVAQAMWPMTADSPNNG